MSGVNVLKELEELRSMLETPKKVFTVGSRFDSQQFYEPAAAPMHATTAAAGANQYSYALNSAEKSVDRLGRAIEAAEDEMEAAVRRTTDVHKSQLRQKEMELQEQQRIMQAKERSIESLRDTLATAKRSYEGRIAQAEAALTLRSAEASATHEELDDARAALETTQLRLQQVLSAHSLELDDVRQHGRDLQASVQARSDEAARAGAQLRSERDQRDAERRDAEDLRRRAELLAEELRVARGDAKAAKDRYEFEIDDLRKRLRSEKNIRKGCEKWLRAELKSRDEYDMLLSAIRETANAKPETTESFNAPASSLALGGGASEPRLGAGGNSGSRHLQKSMGALPSPLAAIPGATAGVHDVERLLATLKASSASAQLQNQSQWSHQHQYPPQNLPYHQQSPHHAYAPPAPSARGAVANELAGGPPVALRAQAEVVRRAQAEVVRRALEDDNRELKAELLATRRLLQERASGARGR